MKRMTLVPMLLAVFSLSVSAQGWTLDKNNSNVIFAVRHMVFSEVQGFFLDYDISLSSSKEDFTDGQIEATVKTATIFTNNERRDNHLRSDDFFNAEKFPEMKFKSTSITKSGENSYKITGNLTIRDVTKEVTFDAQLLGVLKTGSSDQRVGWKATATINRFDYNLRWDRTIETGGLVVGEPVTITLNLQFVRRG